MNVLLVGGSGFLGLHLVDQFYQMEPRPNIHVFDIRPLPKTSPKFYKFDHSAITTHVGDLTSEEDVTKAIKLSKPDVIVHSVSPIHGMGAGVYYKVNVVGTKNLVECAKKQGVKALVYTSSAGVVFNGENIYNVDESTPFPQVAMDAYNQTKADAEVYVLKESCKEFRTTAIRPAGIFGPGDRQMIPALREMGNRGQSKYQLGDNLNLFDVTYVGNVAYGHVLAAKKILDPNFCDEVSGEAFFVTNDSPIYFWSLGKAVWKYDNKAEGAGRIVIPKGVGVVLGYLSQWACALIGKEPTFTAFRVRTACATRYYNITKAKTVLGYEPQTSLEDGIRLTLESMDEQAMK